MTPPTMGEDVAGVAEIARRLSGVQRAAVQWADVHWRRVVGPGKGAFKGRAVREIFDVNWRHVGSGGDYRQTVRLTPLGLAVRAYLEANP